MALIKNDFPKLFSFMVEYFEDENFKKYSQNEDKHFLVKKK